MRKLYLAFAFNVLVGDLQVAMAETVPSPYATPSGTAQTTVSPGPAQVLVDLKYLADLKKQLAEIQSEFPKREPEVERQMWSTFQGVGIAFLVVGGFLKGLEQVLAYRRLGKIQELWKQAKPEDFAKHIEGAAREVIERVLMGTPLADLEKRVRVLETRKP